MGKLSLYWHTLCKMQPGQILWKAAKKLRIPCTLGVVPAAQPEQVTPIASVDALDWDPVFLARYAPEELLDGQVTLLHETQPTDWRTWQFEERSALWQFNLHYQDYLFPLLHAGEQTGDKRFMEQIAVCVNGWIDANPRAEGGHGWAPYPIAMRLTNWLSLYGRLETAGETVLCRRMAGSMHEQYRHLARHLEKELLANHYLEDLKALLLCAVFFQDAPMEAAARRAYKAQLKEQILPDGMHIERSPMYHKLMLEGVLRVATALRGVGRPDAEVESYLPPMLDVAYSFEKGLDRIPLFNDGGNNVARSLAALVEAAAELGVQPEEKSCFPQSGYYLFRRDGWKLIVDAGGPSPAYNPGHAHCSAMSFELFQNGKPVLVNCGTYAYQCPERAFFRSTAAHNTVQVEGVEQSQCWGVFRVARQARVRVLEVSDTGIHMEMTDWQGNRVEREIELGTSLKIRDTGNADLISYLHMEKGWGTADLEGLEEFQACAADEYGQKTERRHFFCRNQVIRINLDR